MSFFQGAELTRLLHDYGYGLVGLLVCLEAIGLPLPGESLVIAAALYAGSTHGMNIAAVVAVTAVGAILGSGIGYAIGRSFGFRVLRRYGHYVGLTEERLKIGRYMFERHGGKVVLLGRFVAFLRNLAALLAGVTQMEWRRFMLANAAGAILWAGLYGFGAYFLGKEAERLAGPVAIGVGVIAVVAVGIGIVFAHRQERRLAAQAERAFSAEPPG